MDCCQPEGERDGRTCPRCGSPGRRVQLLTVKSLLTARALQRLTQEDHRFCATADCDVVYFSGETAFERKDLRVPVFQKEPEGRRMICYCFEVTENDADAAAEERIRALVQAEHCACELRNPEGKCCLGNLRTVLRAEAAEVSHRGESCATSG